MSKGCKIIDRGTLWGKHFWSRGDSDILSPKEIREKFRERVLQSPNTPTPILKVAIRTGRIIKCYDTVEEVEKDGYSVKTIRRAIKQDGCYSAGFFWIREIFSEIVNGTIVNMPPRGVRDTPAIKQTKLNGEVINIYTNFSQAGRVVGLTSGRQIKIACEKGIPLEGFLWRYYD